MPEYKAIVRKFVESQTVFDATLTAYGYFGYEGEEFDYWYDERTLFTPFVQAAVAARPPEKENPVFAGIYRAKLATIGAFHQAGGIITLGTDHVSDGNHLPGFGAHRELDAFVRAGISPSDALRIGTLHGAKALNLERDHGSIEIGKFADFFVVRGNPLERIRNTRNVEWVSTRGRCLDAKELLTRAVGTLGPNSEAEVSDW
jgi:hypothetical protein